jgi:regulation of enolase protein 1 (concanavalin A-like superfamily)
MTNALTSPSLPFALSPSPGGAWRLDGRTGAVSVMAAAHTDIFLDPGGSTTLNAESLLNAATLLGVPPKGDFALSARVSVDFAATFDAGVLLLWVDERHWGKLCFEFSPVGEAMVVSVVTRGVSDDANAFVVTGRSVWLRVSRIDHSYAFHASTDGKRWQMIRFFTIGEATAADKIGFEAQSPTGNGCGVTFDEIRFTRERLADLRDGS